MQKGDWSSFKQSELLARVAGRQAALDGLPWETCYLWASTMQGSANPASWQALSREFLAGWRAECRKQEGAARPRHIAAAGDLDALDHLFGVE